MDDDYLFPDTARTVSRRRGNIMEELLQGKSDTDSTAANSNTQFVLPKQYLSNNNTNDKLESAAAATTDLFGDNSLVKASAERRGRRGISPVVKATPQPEEKTTALNWLELKDEKKEASSTVIESDRAKPSNYLDWLGPKQSPELNTKPNIVIPPISSATAEITNAENLQPLAQSIQKQVDVKVVPQPVVLKPVQFQTQMQSVSNEDDFASTAAVLELKSKLRRSEYEREQLKVELESFHARNEQELQAIENSFKRRAKLMEESYERREKQLQEEIVAMSDAGAERRKAWDKERSELITNWQRKLDENTQQRMDDLERMKEIHHKVFTTLKQDHESAISQLQHIKKFEIEAVTDAHSHSKTLESVIEQLKTNTMELFELQSKVECGLRGTASERELMMRAKDEQVKHMKSQLEKQRADDEQQRMHAQQLISRLEDKLKQQSMDVEEEKWKINQERNRLDLERKSAEESKKLMLEQIEMERKQLQRIKDNFVEEQKKVLENVHRERFSSLHSQQHVEESSFQSMKIEAEMQSNAERLREDKNQLAEMRNELESASRIVEMKKLAVEGEKRSLDTLLIQLKQRSEEVEEMCLSAVRTREEGFQAARESLNLQNEVQKRQELLMTRLEDLKSRERHLAEERIEVGKERRQLEHLRLRLLCVRCQGSVSESPQHQQSWSPLSAWQETADRDKEFLQKESLFLRKLQIPLNPR